MIKTIPGSEVDCARERNEFLMRLMKREVVPTSKLNDTDDESDVHVSASKLA